MKILYVTTIGITMSFFKSFIKEMIDKGHVVDIATNIDISPIPSEYIEWGCHLYNIKCSRNPLKLDNLKAIKQIKRIVLDGKYEVVHCHTPIAAICTRYACRKLRKKGVKIIYTAHGFHFYKGAPKKNWILFYPFEKRCSRWTDLLITINKEDYQLACTKFKAQKTKYIPGVGIDIQKFANSQVDIIQKKKELGLPENSFVILSVGELNVNKNHKVVIDALSKIANPNYYYLIAGIGELDKFLEEYSKTKKVNVHLLGFRKDVAELYKIANLYVHPSFREGLPVSMMEALASGTPVIASNIRGCRDLIDTGLFNPLSVDEVTNCILNYNKNVTIDERFSKEFINKELEEIYANI